MNEKMEENKRCEDSNSWLIQVSGQGNTNIVMFLWCVWQKNWQSGFETDMQREIFD